MFFLLYFNPQFLETKKEKLDIYKTRESYSRTQSVDLGFQVSYGKKFGKNCFGVIIRANSLSGPQSAERINSYDRYIDC